MKLMKTALLGGISLGMVACAPPAPAPSYDLSGSVTVPGGNLAAMQPMGLKTMLANALFGNRANALDTGWTSVGGGVDVKLLEVDADGNMVATLATATTASDGSYGLDVPAGFVPGPKYVIRVGTDSVYVETRIPASSGTYDVNPGSQAASDLVTDIVAALSATLDDLSADELQNLMDETDDALADIDFSAYTDISGFSTAILTTVKDDETRANVLYSSVASGTVCGTVTDSNTAPVQNILVVARDYGSWVTRAKAKTDASGHYCINLPKAGDTDPFSGNTLSGNYIIGAINRTGSSYAASEWWTSGGGANTQYEAEKISVPDTNTVTKDFELLANGARLSGTVQGFDGQYAEGVTVIFRDYDKFHPVVSAKVKADGTYRVNLNPNSDYMISFQNRTNVHPYASEVYSNRHHRNQADRVQVTAGDNGPYDANLESGEVLKGTVYVDAAKSAVAPGMIVSVIDPDLSGTVERMRTNKKGKFRMWVQNATDNPSGYEVTARGQRITKIPDGTGMSFNLDVAEISGTLVSDADGTTPAQSLFVRISPWNGGTNKATAYISQDSSAEDGSFLLYAPVGTYIVYARADDHATHGSGVYDGTNMAKTTYGDVGELGTPLVVADTNPVDLGSAINVPTVGVTSGGTLNTGAGYIDGNAFYAARSVKILDASSGATDQRVVTTASRGDGSFKVRVPAGTYTVKRDNVTCTGVVVADGATKTVTFDASTCSAP